VSEEEAQRRGAVVLAIEILVLDQTETAGLREVVVGVAIFDGVAGRRRRSDGVAFLVTRSLSGEDPVRRERSFVAQGVIASAEILAAEVRAGIAVEGVIRVVDRSCVGARILEERRDQRLIRRDVVREFSRSEIAPALRGDDRALARTAGKRAVDRVVDAIVGAEEPQLVPQDVAAEVETEVFARESLLRSGGGDDRFRPTW
jgi:hypothetical protein